MASGNQSSPALSGFRGVGFFFFIVVVVLLFFSFLKHHMSQRQVHTPRKRVCAAHTHWRFGERLFYSARVGLI